MPKQQTHTEGKAPEDGDFTLRFQGKQPKIDARTLIATLQGITTSIQEINAELRTDRQIDIVVKALGKGSFLIHMELIQSLVTGLFGKEGLDVAHKVITTLVQFLTLRKLLKGKKPAETEEKQESVVLKDETGNSVTIDKATLRIYNQNPTVNKSISDAFDNLYRDESVTGFNIETRRGNITFQANRSDFEGIAVHPELPAESTRVESIEATITIVRMAFEGKYNWDFYWKGNKISAKILDPEFHQLVDRGERFAKGDSLLVKLEITQVYDSSVGVFVNDSFAVHRVLEHVKRNEQTNLDFEGNR